MSRELNVHSVPTIAERIRTAVEIVAIVAAGLWALYTFVYEQRIKPLSENPEFSVPTIVDQGPTTNGVVFLTIHKRVVNTGNMAIDLAAESLSVYGEKLEPRTGHIQGLHNTPVFTAIAADVPRKPVALLFSFAKLRAGAIGGRTNFVTQAHSSLEEDYLIAVPAKTYPVIKIVRKDFVGKAPISPQISVRIERTRLGAYTLQSPQITGEYDSEVEYPIRP